MKRRYFSLQTLAFSLVFTSLVFVGCAHLSSRQVETAPDGTQRVTKIAVTTFWDAHSDLAKLRASTTDKTQGLTLAGLTENASSTNTVEILRHVAAILSAVPH